MRRCGMRACEKIAVVGPGGLQLPSKLKPDEVGHCVAKGQKENYLEFEGSPCRLLREERRRKEVFKGGEWGGYEGEGENGRPSRVDG